MSARVDVNVGLSLTPEQMAEAFWDMGSDEQVAFYAHLHRIAGTKLCFQAAWIVHGIVETDNGDARNAFNTLHDHSADYITNAINIRWAMARRDISNIANAALAAVGGEP